MPMGVPYVPPTYPPVKVSKGVLTTNQTYTAFNGAYMFMGLNGLYGSGITNNVAGLTEVRNDLGVLTGNYIVAGDDALSLIPESFYTSGLGLQINVFMYFSYNSAYASDLISQMQINSTNSDTVLGGKSWSISSAIGANPGVAGNAAVLSFSSPVLLPGVDFDSALQTDMNEYGTLVNVRIDTPAGSSTAYTFYAGSYVQVAAFSL